MATQPFASPKTLTWDDFIVVADKPRDPHDGEQVDAVTQYEFFMPDRAARKDGNFFAMADGLTLLITPDCKVWSGVSQTAALLSHEQFHYDVGFVIARAAAKHFDRLRSATEAGLKTELQAASKLHFVTRNKLLQSRYDKDTNHGTNAYYQKLWKDRMAKCLANDKADQLGGFFL